jgi:hypothetical protein
VHEDYNDEVIHINKQDSVGHSSSQDEKFNQREIVVYLTN